MFAQLGNIQFENLKTFNDFSKTGSAIYAEHSLIDGKPRLQRTGSSLDEINLSIRFQASFCNPKQELAALVSARNESQILPLLWGNGDLSGDYVITEINETIEDADPQGNIFGYMVSLTLKEYVVKNKIQQVQTEFKSKAKAVGEKKPIAKKKTNPPTCPQLISKTVTRIENHGGVINKTMLERGGATNPANKTTINANCSAVSNLSNSIIAKCDTSGSCVYENAILRNNAVTCMSRADNFKFAVNSGGTDLVNDNSNLQFAIKELKTAARSLVNQVITRK